MVGTDRLADLHSHYSNHNKATRVTLADTMRRDSTDRSRARRDRAHRPRPRDRAGTASLAPAEGAAADSETTSTDRGDGRHGRGGVESVETGVIGLRRRTKLHPADGGAGDEFGRTIAVDDAGERVLVGAPGATAPNGTDIGGVYVFSRRGGEFVQTAKLRPPDDQATDAFGTAVDVNSAGTTAVVGWGRGGRGGTGSAAVFERRDARWIHTTTLTPPDSADRGDSRASADAVALDGTGHMAALGAPHADGTGPRRAGNVLVSERQSETWAAETMVGGPYGDGDYWGGAVDLSDSGGVCAVGAPAVPGPGRDDTAGTVTVVRRTGGDWKRTTLLRADDRDDTDRLGAAVACGADGKTVVAGCPGAPSSHPRDNGGAVVFRWTPSGWHQAATLECPSAGRTNFGRSVAVDATGRIVLVGAPAHGPAIGPDADGGAYLFARSDETWRPRAKVAAGDGTDGDSFGVSIDLDASGQTAVVGAPDAGDDRGAAAVFELG